jgi:3-oxoacyl-(acyl-carrier-protein) synthase
MVTPLGHTAPATWEALVAGRSGAAPIRGFDASGFSVHIGAEVKEFNPARYFSDQRLLKFCLPSHAFALVAAQEAMTDADIHPTPETGARWGCTVGAGMLGVPYEDLQTTHRFCCREGEFNPDGLLDDQFPADPIAFCRSQSNTGLGLITRHFGIRGYATAVHTACASGGQALGTALRVLRRGLVDCVLAGGYDSMLNPIGLSGFCLLGALSTDNDTPHRASRPFDASRNGFLLGEGAGFLVLEDWDAAVARGARIYAEFAGAADSLSSYRITDSPPNGDGPIQAMQQAMSNGGVTPETLDYVNAHGTSTQMNDRSECAALKAVLGPQTARVAVSSTKSCMGHLISAAGAVEAAVCALAIRDGLAPVNANLETPDPECDVNIVRGESRRMRIRAALSNSLGFGGSNSCLVFRHPDEPPAAWTAAGTPSSNS